MATSANEVAHVPEAYREKVESVLASLRQRIAQAMNRLGIGHEDPRLIEAHVRFALRFDTSAPRIEDLKRLELERLVYDAHDELTYKRPDLVPLYRERADSVFHIPTNAYFDTELAGETLESRIARVTDAERQAAAAPFLRVVEE
jgi:hypothetical protein